MYLMFPHIKHPFLQVRIVLKNKNIKETGYMVQHKKWNGNDGTFSPWCTNNNSTKKPVPYSIFDALHTKHYHMEIFVSVHFIQVYDLICA
jgi:hypothetical protein